MCALPRGAVNCDRLFRFHRSGQAFGSSKYGRGSNFYMDEVNCSGSESHLLRCSYPGWGAHNCGAGEVSSVKCLTS